MPCRACVLHVCVCVCVLVQLQGLFEHKTKVPSLLNPATHTFKMSQWADNATVGEGDMGTNVVWMYPQVCACSSRAARTCGVGGTTSCPRMRAWHGRYPPWRRGAEIA